MLFQLEQTTKLGPLSGVMKMLPGMSNFANQFNDEDANKQLSKTKAIIQTGGLQRGQYKAVGFQQ